MVCMCMSVLQGSVRIWQFVVSRVVPDIYTDMRVVSGKAGGICLFADLSRAPCDTFSETVGV